MPLVQRDFLVPKFYMGGMQLGKKVVTRLIELWWSVVCGAR